MRLMSSASRLSTFVLATCCAMNVSAQPEPMSVGTIHVPPYEMPLSTYMSDGAKRALMALIGGGLPFKPRTSSTPLRNPLAGELPDIVSIRAATDRDLNLQLVKAKGEYSTIIEETKIGGVRVIVVTPAEGVATQNRNRVLIHLHGGGFALGAGTLQLIESIPIAGTAKIKVISVAYRLAPEHSFPAGTEDVAAVYRELITQYDPPNIGIYGSSAGGGLTLMSVAWFQRHGLPRPGAIAVLSPSGPITGGDSAYTAPPVSMMVMPPPAVPNPPAPLIAPSYFSGVDTTSALVSPDLHPDLLAQFPSTLLVTGTRDYFGSFTIHVHRQLVRAGVDAQIQLWDGMWHSFYQDVQIPESKEVYEVLAKWFEHHLGSHRRE